MKLALAKITKTDVTLGTLHNMNTLPPAEHYFYFNYLHDSAKTIPFTEFKVPTDLSYFEQERYEKLYLSHPDYIRGKDMVELGCHVGYASYICKHLGAKSVHGLNARKHSINTANAAFAGLNQTNYRFEVGDLEDNQFLSTACANKNTAIVTAVLEHLRNPYSILNTISNSSIDHLILQSEVLYDSNPPYLKYYAQETSSPWSVYDNNKEVALGCVPNISWFDMILQHLGWQLEDFKVEPYFAKGLVAQSNSLSMHNSFFHIATIFAKKANVN